MWWVYQQAPIKSYDAYHSIGATRGAWGLFVTTLLLYSCQEYASPEYDEKEHMMVNHKHTESAYHIIKYKTKRRKKKHTSTCHSTYIAVLRVLSTIWCGVFKPSSYYDGVENQIATLLNEPSNTWYYVTIWWLGPENQNVVKRYQRVALILGMWCQQKNTNDNESKRYSNTRRRHIWLLYP